MRKSIKELVGIISETLPILEPVYEFGALQVAGCGQLADMRPLFPGKQYVGCDYRGGPGVDKVLDLHGIDLPDSTAGTVLVIDTLEHVEYPHLAMEEVHRITRPGGMAVISSVMNFPIHEHPYDFWRFTPEAFKSILKPFQSSLVCSAGDPEFPHTVFGIAFKGESTATNEFLCRLEDWRRRWYPPEGWSWKYVRRQLTPPALRSVSRKIKTLLR